MNEIGIGEIWESAKTVLDLRYMVALFFVCLYFFKFSPFSGRFEGRKKEWTLGFGIVLGAVFVTIRFFEIGISKDLWKYHLYLMVSFCVTTSFYEHLAGYLITKLDSVLGKKE